MIRLVSLLVFVVGLAHGQLNFEGNPLTEYTDYTAEESSLSERSSKERVSNSAISLRPQKLYPIFESENTRQPSEIIDDLFSVQNHRSQDVSARQLQVSGDQNALIDPAEVALNTFLNSKTPEESRVSLDHFLRSQQSPEAQPRSSGIILTDQDKRLERIDTQPVIHRVEHHERPSLQAEQPQQSLLPQAGQTIQVQLTPQSVNQNFGYAAQPVTQAVVQPVIRASAGILSPATMLHPVPVAPDIPVRNDPMMWRQRMKRIRAKPGVLAQARVAPMFYKGPVAVPFKGHGPVEVIYTKPPGFRGPTNMVANSPVPYENAGAWFPDSDYPPPSKDVYYSQLYAQSYDPHYYNYIAATGKVRPYLYGKLGKHKEEQDEGIWAELYRGFTKHGLKNIMTPTFLLGMTLPVVTLMLSALVQKRSIARADARDLDQENALQEYLERMQRAMMCYGSNRDASTKDNC
ncbi:hypothetical protein EAI_16442 [Harpegnathos saltator]|uniref:Uncharacterized protein n=2 Tax=Harpegnathos saltator TaxID=610380 RepID=E2C5I5_HARSA|nr:hypothetical protein EAI_16442 [Harpegnathos saltator]